MSEVHKLLFTIFLAAALAANQSFAFDKGAELLKSGNRALAGKIDHQLPLNLKLDQQARQVQLNLTGKITDPNLSDDSREFHAWFLKKFSPVVYIPELDSNERHVSKPTLSPATVDRMFRDDEIKKATEEREQAQQRAAEAREREKRAREKEEKARLQADEARKAAEKERQDAEELAKQRERELKATENKFIAVVAADNNWEACNDSVRVAVNQIAGKEVFGKMAANDMIKQMEIEKVPEVSARQAQDLTNQGDGVALAVRSGQPHGHIMMVTKGDGIEKGGRFYPNVTGGGMNYAGRSMGGSTVADTWSSKKPDKDSKAPRDEVKYYFISTKTPLP